MSKGRENVSLKFNLWNLGLLVCRPEARTTGEKAPCGTSRLLSMCPVCDLKIAASNTTPPKQSAKLFLFMNDMKEDLKRLGYMLTDERRPTPGTPVMVITASAFCIGYLDHSGQWRCFRDDSFLGDVLGWKACGNAAIRAISGLKDRRRR
jgi:hypothetical protein